VPGRLAPRKLLYDREGSSSGSATAYCGPSLTFVVGVQRRRALMLDGTAWARSNSADRWSMHQDANRVIVIDLPFGDQGAQAFDLAVRERLALS
jgi:hypothetical protein